MKLSSRFLFDSLFVVAGAFLTVASMAWAANTAGWTAFGVSVGVAALAALSVALTRKGSQRAGHSLVGLIAIWSVIASLVFSGSLLTWFVFADAIALGVAALADLAVHEATTERIVHQLEVRDLSSEGHIPA
ncbi:MAG TPA: hypothetical protein VN714_23825 [Trebonia sp.]|jgi:hypothetical protein|nr:hypothetical protein [Trebonia sp.]